MAKNRTLNEIRQSKEYQIALQGGDFIKPTNKPAKSTAEVIIENQIKKVKDNRTHPCSESTAKAIAEHQLSHANEFQLEELKGENFYRNPFEHEEVNKTVDQIVEDLQPQIFDTIFQIINDEMTKRYIFDSTEYLTEAGLELFEDEWFEFYHENHGKIMHKLIQNLK